jgi:Domain of Unknown Function (DUF1259)
MIVAPGLLLIWSVSWLGAPQSLPSEYEEVLTLLGKKGDFRDSVLKVNVPRADLAVTIAGRAAPTPFGFGGWVAFTKATGGFEVMMGDLVLTEEEVNPVMSLILSNGLEVTALHNHFFREEPRIFYMHVHGRGGAAELARKLAPAIGWIDDAARKRGASSSAGPAASGAKPGMNTEGIARIVGHPGETNGPVYKITIGRPDIDLRDHGALINARMGLNTWAAFVGTDEDAMVAGDVAMLEHEVTPVLAALREKGIDIVAIHHHMTGTSPVVIFLHYYGTGRADRLAGAVGSAIDLLGKPAPTSHAVSR